MYVCMYVVGVKRKATPNLGLAHPNPAVCIVFHLGIFWFIQFKEL